MRDSPTTRNDYAFEPSTPRLIEKSTKVSMKKRIILSVLAVTAIAGSVIGAIYLTNGPNDSTSNSLKTSNTVNVGAFNTSGTTTTGNGKDNFLSLHVKQNDSQFLHLTIPKHTLKKPFLTHAILNKGVIVDGETPSFYAMNHMGIEITDQIVFHFELSEDKQGINYVREQWVLRTTDKDMENALKESTWTGSEVTLPIVGQDENSYTIDASVLARNGFYVTDGRNGKYSLGIQNTRAFPENANIVMEYDAPVGWYGEKGAQKYNIFFCLRLLPEEPMTARVTDDRIGYFHTEYKDVGLHNGLFGHGKKYPTRKLTQSLRSHNNGNFGKQNIKKNKKQNGCGHLHRRQSRDLDSSISIASRRRLEKDPHGNVITPITFYIDPTVPNVWRKYFKQGVLRWQKAFSAAGFENAIKVVLPTDSDWPKDYHVGDLRYSSISMALSTQDSALAIGPSVVDPRSGEILGSDIVFSSTWAKVWLGDVERNSPVLPSYTGNNINSSLEDSKSTSKAHLFQHRGQCQHSRMKQDSINLNMLHLSTGYMAGEVTEEIIGAGFADVAAHESGHTLGLRHNFMGSTARTVEQLKNSNYVKEHGLSSSVMDYVPVNVWSNMTQEQVDKNVWFTPVVGEYDIAAIIYGYKHLYGEQSGVKHPELTNIAKSAPVFATDDDANTNPFNVRHDMSDDPAAYWLDRIEIVKNAQETNIARSVDDDETWTNLWLRQRYNFGTLNYAAKEIQRYLGGTKTTHAHRDSINPNGPDVQYVSKKDQMRALDGILSVVTGEGNVYPTPDTYKNYVERVHHYGVVAAPVDAKVQTIRSLALSYIMNEKVFTRIVEKGSSATMTLADMFTRCSSKILENPMDFSSIITMKTYLKLLSQASGVSDPRIAAPALYEIKNINSMLTNKTNSTSLSTQEKTTLLLLSGKPL